MGKKLNIGLVGYGLNAILHKFELERNPLLIGRTNIITAFDPDPEVRKNVDKINELMITGSLDDLINTPGLEAILINSPPQYHADQAVIALESGLHVFSEVPMALTESDLERIIGAEEASGKCYHLGENYIFIPEVLYAGYLISSSKIGPAVYAESEYLHDVTYRWRQGFQGDTAVPRIDSWYQLFDP